MTFEQIDQLKSDIYKIKGATGKNPVRAKTLGSVLQNLIQLAFSSIPGKFYGTLGKILPNLGEEWQVLDEPSPGGLPSALCITSRYGYVIGEVDETNKKIYIQDSGERQYSQDLSVVFEINGRKWFINLDTMKLVDISSIL